MKTTIPLLTPYKMGQFDLSHRVVLPPLTRQRAYGGVPQPHVAVYYAQRASPGGFLISEGTRVSDGQTSPAPLRQEQQQEPSSFVDVPGIWAREVGGHRVGVRLDQFDATADEHALALHVVSRLSDRGVLYCHMIEPRVDGRRRVSRRLLPFREAFGGTFIASGGYGRDEGDAAVGEGYADLVAYGRLFLANPDLPRRFELGAPLNECDAATFYGAGAADPAVGYIDYPFFD
jgi:2,4-dienoyl-CoA reductase-like NADH-dependent reductase (Old Yellow Enzyme family)